MGKCTIISLPNRSFSSKTQILLFDGINCIDERAFVHPKMNLKYGRKNSLIANSTRRR
jgi:hypothetical protein